MAPTSPIADPKETSARPLLIPPEEQFWQRFSPHQEAPLSGVSSAMLHILVICLLLGVIWLQQKLNRNEENRSVPIEPVRIAPGGDSGDHRGKGDNPGDGLNREVGDEKEDPTRNAPKPD